MCALYAAFHAGGMEHVISHSFSQFQHERQLPQLEAALARAQEEARNIDLATGSEAREYVALKQELEAAQRVVAGAMLKPERCLHLLRPGRIVRVADGESSLHESSPS